MTRPLPPLGFRIILATDRCTWGWAGCDAMYTGGHLCDLTEGHKGACKCGCCGARTTVALATRRAVP